MSRSSRDWQQANMMDFNSPTDDDEPATLTRVSSQSHNNRFYAPRPGKGTARSRALHSNSSSLASSTMPIPIPANPNVIPGNTLPSAPASPPTPAPSPTPMLRRPSWSPAESTKDDLADLELDEPLSGHSSNATQSYSYGHRHMRANFAEMSNHERQLILAELLNMCDGKTLAYVANFVSPRLKRDPFSVLPNELCLRILTFIEDATTLARSSAVSKRWRELVSDDMAWKSLCEKHAFQRWNEDNNGDSQSRFSMIDGDLRGASTHPYGTQMPGFGQITNPAIVPMSSSAPDLLRHSTFAAPAITSPAPVIRSSSKRLGQRPKAVSYRSHFKHRYLISKAWRAGGMLSSHTITPDQGVVTSLHLTQDYIVVGLDNAKIHVFGPTGEHLRSLHGHVMGVWAMAPHGNILVSGGCDRDVRVWDLSTGQPIHMLRGHTSTVRCIKISPSKGPGQPDLAISGSRDTTLRVWDITKGVCRHVLQGHQASVRCLDIHGDLVVSGSYDTTARIWSITDGRCLRTLQGHFSQIYAVAFDGRRVATGSLDTSVRVWDPNTGRCLAQLQGHTSLVGQLQLRHDTLVTGGSDGSVRVWSLETYSAIHRLAAHDNSVTSLQFDDVRIVSGGSDGRVKVWDLASGRLVRELGAPAEAVWRVVFQEEKAVVLASRASRTVMEVWSFAPPQEEGELAVARGIMPASIRLDGALSSTSTPLSIPSMEMDGFLQFDRPAYERGVSEGHLDEVRALQHEVEMTDVSNATMFHEMTEQ
ncbi:hypothetical protein AMS68_005798 [Peltaster fructicola]|uniref:F-box domain-containing protein n=1 Tax=Peltaster fructicola TaxID=286661 RepID=A0A6H0Y036_9PEZI|nr:hypothetical protein AMS68_005798 [Peltaster fructicola]